MTAPNLPVPVAPAGAYRSARSFQGSVYVSGQVPWEGSSLLATGRLGDDVDIEQGARCAYQAALNALAAAAQVADMSRVVATTMRVYLRTTPDFTDHVAVADGASRAILEVLGEAGHHSRTTVGVVSLPLGAPVEVELTLGINS